MDGCGVVTRDEMQTKVVTLKANLDSDMRNEWEVFVVLEDNLPTSTYVGTELPQ